MCSESEMTNDIYKVSDGPEELIKELEQKLKWDSWRIKEVANFILSDRRRIVETLIKLRLCNGGSSYEMLCREIEKTLNRAGVGMGNK